MEKALKIIASCKTLEQLEGAVPYLRGGVKVKKEIEYVKLEVELTEANPN